MKKIISNRKYDTDTASMVGEWSNDYPANDFHFESVTLYRKRNGEYFLHGEGGAMSRYASAVELSGWASGERIMPLSYDDARTWAEEHLDADSYEREFGEVSEDEEESVVLSVRVSPAAKAALDRAAARTGQSKGELVSKALLALS